MNFIIIISILLKISLLLALPDVAYSFLYRTPNKITEYIIYFSASREITISTCNNTNNYYTSFYYYYYHYYYYLIIIGLYRNFWWYNNILWLEDIPSHIGVIVGVAESCIITIILNI